MGRIRNSIALLKQSWAILKQDRELIWLPVISALIAAVVAAAVLIPVALSQDWDALSASNDAASQQVSPGVIAALVGLTVALAFISIFFRAAVVSGAHERMSGGDPTVRSAIAGALERLPKLFGWAVITSIVGMILRALEERSGWVGRFVINAIGMAWAVTTFLVIPVIVIENTGAIASTKRSVNLFRNTWGDNLTAQIGFSLLGILVFIPVVLIAAIGVAIGTAAGFVLVAAAVVAGIVLATVLSALGGVFQTALYHYVVGSQVVDGIDRGLMSTAFAQR